MRSASVFCLRRVLCEVEFFPVTSVMTSSPVTVSSGPTVAPPAAYTLPPTDTIWGYSVDTVTYVLLAVSAVAPLIFIIVVLISIKCYSRHRHRQHQQYPSDYRVYRQNLSPYKVPQQDQQQVWQGDKLANQHHYRQPGTEQFVENEPAQRMTDILLKPSVLNPNVYFRETPKALPVTDTGVEQIQTVSKLRETGDRHTRLQTQQSIGSEEARVMAAFDQIYDDMDMGSSEEGSEGVPSPDHVVSANNDLQESANSVSTLQDTWERRSNMALSDFQQDLLDTPLSDPRMHTTTTSIVPQAHHHEADDTSYGVSMHVHGLPPSNGYQYTVHNNAGAPLQAFGVVVHPTRTDDNIAGLSTNAAVSVIHCNSA